MSKKKKLADHFFNTIECLCGDIFENLNELITDIRKSYLIRYEVKDIIITTVLMFITKINSRRNIADKFNEKNIIESIKKFNNTDIEKCPNGDTVEKFVKTVNVEELKELLHLMNIQLIRNKKFKKTDLLLGEYYMICIDMTRTQKFNRKVNKELLWEKKNGKIYYYNAVVEAKFVTPGKLCIPILTEFVENTDTINGEYVKQDCELKAAYRLIEKLKDMFPRLKICLLLDGLYPNQTIFNLCKEYGFKYIMSFKEEKIPSLFHKFQEFKKINYIFEKKKIVSANEEQRAKFQNDLDYCEYKINFIEFKEYKKRGRNYQNIFITNIDITDENIFFITKAGRLRWKIEHAFRKQKRYAFNLEHAYSHNRNSIKAYHILMQIADWILTFMLYLYNENGESLVYKDFKSLTSFYEYIYLSFVKDTVNFNDENNIKYARFVEPKSA